MLTQLSLTRTATPILYRECRAGERDIHELSLVSLVPALYVSVLMVWGELIIVLERPHWTVVLIFMALLVGSFWLAVLVHELGHLLVGLLAGFTMTEICVLGLRYSCVNKVRRFQVLWKRTDSSGFVLMMLRSPDHVVLRTMLYVAGGPLATALLLAAVVTHHQTLTGKAFLLTNIFVAMGSFLPVTSRTKCSDARVILTLLSGGVGAERLSAVLFISAVSKTLPPAMWPPEFVRRLHLDTSDRTYENKALTLRYQYDLHCGSSEATGAALERLLASSVYHAPDHRRWLFLQAAWFHIAKSTNLELAELWVREAKETPGNNPSTDLVLSHLQTLIHSNRRWREGLPNMSGQG